MKVKVEDLATSEVKTLYADGAHSAVVDALVLGNFFTIAVFPNGLIFSDFGLKSNIFGQKGPKWSDFTLKSLILT